MNRKLMTLFAALTAFVAMAVVPALASASTVGTLQTHAGTPLAVGTNVIGTSTNLKFTTGSGATIQCVTNTLTGKVTKNDGHTFSGEITTSTHNGRPSQPTPHGTHCDSSLGISTIKAENLPWCLFGVGDVTETDTVTLDGCGAGNIKFTATVTPFGFSIATCTYENEKHVVASYVTNASPLVLTIKAAAFKRTAGAESCGNTGTLTGSFTLNRDDAGVSGTNLKVTNTT